VAKESKGLYTNDECFKMALTDAISVSCKALGFGADIYWSGDNTKYNDQKKQNFNNQQPQQQSQPQQQQNFNNQQGTSDICSDCGDNITPNVKKFSQDKYGKALCFNCQKKN